MTRIRSAQPRMAPRREFRRLFARWTPSRTATPRCGLRAGNHYPRPGQVIGIDTAMNDIDEAVLSP